MPAAFIETRFPTDISYSSSGGPEFSTDIAVVDSGHEQRNINWEQSRARFNAAYGIRTHAQLQAVIAFFRVMRGKAYGFRYKDWLDYQATNEAFAVGDASETVFQLGKTYAVGGSTETYYRSITKPVAGTIAIYLDGVSQPSGWTLDTTTGQLTFTIPPDTDVVISADFEYDTPVRFDIDHLNVSLDAFDTGSIPDIPIVEIRPTL